MIAKTPPMGFNTWNTFAADIDEKMVMEMADVMVAEGYRDAGYEYVVIDDCWSLRERDENGCLVADPAKFPHGIKYLSDYVHSKGLKFGMYSCAGTRTCAGFPGSFDHEYQDARTFAEWGVDFLKYDYCYFPQYANGRHRYLTMAQALRASGRDIVFSACNWGADAPWDWMRSIGAHMYRSTGDIVDTFESTAGIIRSQLDKFNANAPGCFNDIDMMTVGMYGAGNVGREQCNTYDEYVTQFAFWCFVGAPLMMGADLRKMDGACKALLQNRDLIALNQDPDCRPAWWLRDIHCGHLAMMRQLSDGTFAIGIFNLNDGGYHVEIPFTALGVPCGSGVKLAVTDLLTGEDLGERQDDLFVTVEHHACRVFKVRFVTA